MAVCAPSERLVVSYVAQNAEGEPMAESVLVSSIKKILPNCVLLDQPGEMDAESERDAFEQAALTWRRQEPKAAALREIFKSREDYRARLSALDRAAYKKTAAFSDKKTAQELFGRDILLSASRIESYYRCRFAYFCRYGLKAMPRRTADLDALAFGTLTHWVMEHVLPKYTETGYHNIERSQVERDTGDAVMKYVEECIGGLEDKPARFAALLNRLSRVAAALLWHVVCELRQSRFVPVDFELNVGGRPEEGQPAVPPVILSLPDGSKVRVQGKIDRVDVYKRDGVSYVRVIDYKTGAKSFKLSEIVEGINVQMLIYLFAVCQNGGGRYGRTSPAGVLYLPAKLPVVQAERGQDSEKIGREQIRSLRMNGLLIDDPEIIGAMEKDIKGLFIPAALKADGGFKKHSSIASLKHFGLLKKRIDSLLIEMAQTLKSGDIAAYPAAGEVEACEWCDYKTICGHEFADPVRFIEKRDNSEVLNDLENHGN